MKRTSFGGVDLDPFQKAYEDKFVVDVPHRPDGTYGAARPRARGTRQITEPGVSSTPLFVDLSDDEVTQPFVRMEMLPIRTPRTPLMTMPVVNIPRAPRVVVPILLTKRKVSKVKPPKAAHRASCNRHTDCVEADMDTLLGHGHEAEHCSLAGCECCVGY
jgi:hypothetical protein